MTTLSAPPLSKSTNVRPSPSPALRLVGGLLRAIDTIAPPLASRLAARMFVTPRRVPRPDSEKAWIASASSERRTVAGMPITIWSRGTGPVVLLIHGWEGRGSQLGALGDLLVEQGWRIVVPDLPAHGDSSGRQTNLLEFAAITRELIVDLDPHAVIAHSFGCAATNVALRDVPEFRRPLVYIAPPEDFEHFTSIFSAMLGVSEGLASRMVLQIERNFGIRWSELRGLALAPLMTAPLLVIHDEDDSDVPLRFGRALAEAWPNARLVITRGLGHRRILRDAAVMEAAVEFIAGSE